MFNEAVFKANFFAQGGREDDGSIRWGIAPIFVWGPPGTHKTARMRKLAKIFDCDFVHTIVLGNETPATIGGAMFPDASGQFFRRLPSKWVHDANQAKRALIIIDEFGDAPPLMQAAAQRMINEREVGDTPLKGHVRLACIGNPLGMSTNAYETSMAAANRGGHESVAWSPSQHCSEWAQWLLDDGGEDYSPTKIDADAEEARVSACFPADYAYAKGVVASFVHTTKKLLVIPPEGHEDRSRAWSSERTMFFVTRWLAAARTHNLSEIDRDKGIAMFIGQGMAKEFAAWRSKADLPAVEDILDGTVEFKHMISRPDITMHVMTAASALIADVDVNRPARLAVIYKIMRSICENEPGLCVQAAAKLSRVPFKNADKRRVNLQLFDSDDVVRNA